jgi:DNA-binding NtrC family response regulator
MDGLRGEIELLVTDLMLPDTTGLELADAIRARRPALPVLLMSGYAPTEVLHHRIHGRGLCFLEKPFMMDQLLSAVSQALQGSVGWGGAMTG